MIHFFHFIYDSSTKRRKLYVCVSITSKCNFMKLIFHDEKNCYFRKETMVIIFSENKLMFYNI